MVVEPRSVAGSQTQVIIPFLKWAGGKRWLIHRYPNIFPRKFNKYIEPFLGSGAVFFHLHPQKAILSDLNRELIETYRAIKSDWESIWKLLRTYHRSHDEAFYYRIRSSDPFVPSRKAAKFIYLNRTCWNGLYRVNLNGEFNVPIGTKSTVIFDTDNFSAISKALTNVKLMVCDFEKTIQMAEKGDFLFVDPPYTIKHNTNGFIKYNETLFTWNDQVRLRDNIAEAKRRGVKVLVTNANHKSVKQLYQGMGQQLILSRSSTISGDAQYRDAYSELIVKCY